MDTRPPRGSGGDEPWRDEPSCVNWRDPSSGYQCLILRSFMGNLCGYVRVPRDHALHGKPYTQRAVYRSIEVHGGLTFSGCIRGRWMKRGHWFGFDCAHLTDIVPGMVAFQRLLPPRAFAPHGMPPAVYRDVNYVRAQCTVLAEQLSKRKG